ncbi:MAG: hypothetical protein CMH49_10380 [Myxococcales bacterium]|nr:hypothetical protein [Myxococcales bacterium]
MINSPIYLDENATASPDFEVMKAVYEWQISSPANASSIHTLGRRARGAIELSRRQLAQALGVSPRHLTFTSGATEALHTLIEGLLNPGDHILVSAVEHPAVWGALSKLDVDVEIIAVNSKGQVDPHDFVKAKRANTRLAIMMAAQNEIGTIYPIKSIAEALEDTPLLVDAVQAFGKISLKLEETGASYAVLSGHKVGAPQGVGVIWSRGGQSFTPLLKGGAQERGRRAGTENVSAIVGLGVAASRIDTRLKKQVTIAQKREQFRHTIQQQFQEYFTVVGEFLNDPDFEAIIFEPNWRQHGQLPNTLSLLAQQGEGDLLLQQLDLAGFCLSAGSACSSGALEPSPVLQALGFSTIQASRALRLSMGPMTSNEDLQALTKQFNRMFKA